MLPYSSEVLFTLYERYLHAWLPYNAGVCAAMLLACVLIWSRLTLLRRIACLSLACGWLWVGVVFLYGYAAQIDFSARLYAALFVIQGVALLVYAIARPCPRYQWPSDARAVIALVLIVWSIGVYPVMYIVSGHAVGTPRLVGLAPTPTAILTLGLWFGVRESIPRTLFVIPLIWCLIAGFTGWVLHDPADLFSPLAAIAALFLLRRRQTVRPMTPRR